MKNSESRKYYVIKIMLFTIFFLFLFSLFYNYQYKSYIHNYNEKISSIIKIINIKYPNVTKNELMKILNSEETDKNIFREYGININEDSLILKNDSNFKIFAIMDIILITFLVIIISFLFLKYDKRKNKEIKKVTKYLEEINRKNYKLDIDENEESELSILKNEIYKTTILLKEQTQQLTNDKNSLKNSLSDISHQLKTPLTSIGIMLDNILDNPNMAQETKNDFIRNIKRETSNINFLVQSILKLSQFDSNTIVFSYKEEYIQKIVKEAINNVESLCDLKNIEIIVKGIEKEKINCDLKWQVEAITNILKNSVEHSIEGSKIFIEYNNKNMYLELMISDTGKGIKEKDLPHIFERFYKGENSNRDSIGIGLALSKAIIQENDGKISVESSKNKGTKFIIRYYKGY